jgi:FixJ family two-component response regulator
MCGASNRVEEAPVVAIVDDDGSVRLATECLVRSLGLATRTYASAEEFLLSADLDRTACVIVDVQMPGMSGIDLQGVLYEKGNRIPIILMTAFPDERIQARALHAGAVGFLIKPFGSQMLVEYLRRALIRSRSLPVAVSDNG